MSREKGERSNGMTHMPVCFTVASVTPLRDKGSIVVLSSRCRCHRQDEERRKRRGHDLVVTRWRCGWTRCWRQGEGKNPHRHVVIGWEGEGGSASLSERKRKRVMATARVRTYHCVISACVAVRGESPSSPQCFRTAITLAFSSTTLLVNGCHGTLFILAVQVYPQCLPFPRLFLTSPP